MNLNPFNLCLCDVAGGLSHLSAADAGGNVDIVPMAATLDSGRDVSSWLIDNLTGRAGTVIDDDARDALLARYVSIGTSTLLSELHDSIDPEGSGGQAVENFDPVWAKAVAAKLNSVDIVNISSGTVYPCASIPSEFRAACREEFLSRYRGARRALPLTASAVAQADTPDDDKTLVVWAAENLRTVLGDGARMESMELVSRFEELRGHNIGVTALDDAREGLADYAHLCGALPEDWDAAADGEHYCLPAPGVHDVDYPYNPGQVTDKGTSYAAPVVSATLDPPSRTPSRCASPPAPWSPPGHYRMFVVRPVGHIGPGRPYSKALRSIHLDAVQASEPQMTLGLAAATHACAPREKSQVVLAFERFNTLLVA